MIFQHRLVARAPSSESLVEKLRLAHTNMNKNLTKDLLSISLLLVLHPVIYHLHESAGHYPPDSVKYMVFARDFLSQGLLYLETGLAGQGNILPPFYPFLIVIGRVFSTDTLMVAEIVSGLSILALSVVFYFIFRRWANRYFAVLAILAIQTNYQLGLWALTPLTEASFVLVVACVLWLTLHNIGDDPQFTAQIDFECCGDHGGNDATAGSLRGCSPCSRRDTGSRPVGIRTRMVQARDYFDQRRGRRNTELYKSGP